ncbi:5-oxoprolinase subunit PxpB [Fictibacillus phosphorivorans]|uniref:5-oxoprolinase subunit PxpB n=1 Tax=Fictibacillus phosphorivorans TaxID=1221500 RepID=UPI00203FCCDB|nr:5-oxoprolinase subunit PxpB [Fictibacillus phosphorivorans]MCM3717829.1 5-oxoprolinase subunit PxpB [Fictibacillus phosphorivorans]MCM3777057.1 5-oxoprolinase subunit PxpB [Fictibacillus phosphorivorans]
MEFNLQPLGDNSVIIELGEDISRDIQQKVKKVSSFLEQQSFDWMVEYVPGFTTVAVFYDPCKIEAKTLPYDEVCEELSAHLEKLAVEEGAEPRIVEIPVCYGGEFGPDLEEVAERNDLTPEEVIDIHSNGEYIVYMIGFAPGFPYIGGMDERIAAPRRKNPRLKIPAGSVGIAGKQTGVYPIETPGGWQLIGKTPRKLFLPEGETPSLLQAGDQIKFVPISVEEFQSWEEKEND